MPTVAPSSTSLTSSAIGGIVGAIAAVAIVAIISFTIYKIKTHRQHTPGLVVSTEPVFLEDQSQLGLANGTNPTAAFQNHEIAEILPGGRIQQ